MYFSHWYLLDSLLALLISVWVSLNALRGLYQNLGILLQIIPENVDLQGLQQEIQALAQSRGIDHLTLELEAPSEACELENC